MDGKLKIRPLERSSAGVDLKFQGRARKKTWFFGPGSLLEFDLDFIFGWAPYICKTRLNVVLKYCFGVWFSMFLLFHRGMLHMYFGSINHIRSIHCLDTVGSGVDKLPVNKISMRV